MVLRSLLTLCAVLSLSTGSVTAQAPDGAWRVGVALIAPSRLLDATDGELRSAPGVALEVGRRWRPTSELPPFVRVRLSRVATEATRGTESWDPGAITSVDVVAGASHPVSARVLAHAGLGAGLWSTPDAGAPFAAMGALRPLVELGVDVALTPRLRATLSASGTTVPADAARAQTAGYYWRPMLGVARAF